MNNQQAKKTHKLFYGEYPYKIVTITKLASHLRYKSVSEIIEYCQHPLDTKPWAAYLRTERISKTDRDNFIEYCTVLSKYVDKSLKTRIESGAVTYFIKDKNTYQSMLQDFKSSVYEYWEPENDDVLSLLSANKKTVICNEYPHGKYKYKLTLKPFKGTAGSNLLEWVDKYTEDKIYVPKGSRNYLKDNHPYYDPYIYVRDEKMLMLINFASSGNVRRCEEFILRSSINTSP